MTRGWLVYQLRTDDYVFGWELGVCRVFAHKGAATEWWRELRQMAFDSKALHSDDLYFDKDEQEARAQIC